MDINHSHWNELMQHSTAEDDNDDDNGDYLFKQNSSMKKMSECRHGIRIDLHCQGWNY